MPFWSSDKAWAAFEPYPDDPLTIWLDARNIFFETRMCRRVWLP
ncbi:hypothetical protein [Microvirga mediterraneensis]|nr:hypothetical protein [Microvirga mediterraneensis]